MDVVKTRFAPSPTGHLHIGGLRTALYSFALAKSEKGKFILRIEDTDRKRYVEGATEKLIKTLKLFGINWDEGPEIGGPQEPYIQSQRMKTGIYQKYAEELVKNEHAYYCFCKPKTKEEIKKAHQRKEVELRDPCRRLSEKEAQEKIKSGIKPAIRLRVPDTGEISFYDFVIKKDISWKLKDVDEVMLLKSDGFPTYHLGVVVDDHLMGVTHVTRAHEWLPSTPVYLLMYKYLGFSLPKIGHLTDILDPEGGKLSKRKGSVACEEFLEEGFLPEAILNFIMLLGWAPKDNREMFSLDEFVENFKKGSLQISNPIFNREKLKWFNGFYIREKSDEEVGELIFKYLKGKYEKDKILETMPLVKERISTLAEYLPLAGFFFERKDVDFKLFGKNKEKHLKAALNSLKKVGEWKKESLDEVLITAVKDNDFKTGDFFMDLRIAITGSKFTPPINESLVILGKEETLERIESVLKE